MFFESLLSYVRVHPSIHPSARQLCRPPSISEPEEVHLKSGKERRIHLVRETRDFFTFMGRLTIPDQKDEHFGRLKLSHPALGSPIHVGEKVACSSNSGRV